MKRKTSKSIQSRKRAARRRSRSMKRKIKSSRSVKRKSVKHKSVKRKSNSVKSRKRITKAKKSSTELHNLIRRANGVINGPRLSIGSSSRKIASQVLKKLQKHPRSRMAEFLAKEITVMLKKEK